MTDYTDKQLRDGRRRLLDMLPAARADVARGEHKVEMVSAVGAAQAPFMGESNLMALVVYPAPLGGWHADLLLRETPPGVSNVMGTPSNTPCRTREEAEQAARAILRMALSVAATHAAEPTRDRGFALYDINMTLPGHIMDRALELLPELAGAERETEDEVNARIEQVLSRVFGGQEPTRERWEALSRERQIDVLAVACRAVISGVFRYPPKMYAPPGEQGPFRPAPGGVDGRAQ